MIEPRQIRAARALLNWSQGELADASGIAVSSIKNVENSITTARKETLEDIQKAFEKSGVEFLPGSGVRMREQSVTVLHGNEGYWGLLDDVYHTLIQTESKEVCVLGLDEDIVTNALSTSPEEGGEKLSKHIMRLQKNRITERLIIRKGDTNIVAPLAWYRCIEEKYFAPYPLYVYGNKIGILYWGPPFKAIIYENREISDSLKRIFDFVWDKSEPVIIDGNGRQK
jgi:transcriptional regulator with XRE-family HTH domain